MARAVARGFGGRVPALLRGEERQGDVRDARTTAQHDGARTPDAERDVV